MSISFVDFYRENNISPVRQDISDLNRHFQRRENLFKMLGLVPSLIGESSILEFGPGSGHNCVYTASLMPKKYVLIDANETGLNEAAQKLRNSEIPALETHLCLFEEFQSDEMFDIVWAEGCIPHQHDPASVAKTMSKFVKPGGVFVITCVSGLSYLSEIMRRLVFLSALNGKPRSVENKLEMARPFMVSHLSKLENMSRFVDDWILDNMIQPFGNAKLFSIPLAIAHLGDEFDVYKSSPDLNTDWRWYKDLIGEEVGLNSNFLKNYFSKNVNLIDRRMNNVLHPSSFGRELESIGDSLWESMCDYENGSVTGMQTFKSDFQKLMHLIESCSVPQLSDSMSEAFVKLDQAELTPDGGAFSDWWGRGQQYVSFIRR